MGPSSSINIAVHTAIECIPGWTTTEYRTPNPWPPRSFLRRTQSSPCKRPPSFLGLDRGRGSACWGIDLAARRLENSATHVRTLRRQEHQDSTNLRLLIGSADGFQQTALTSNDSRHYANTLFNVLRGGIPLRGYLADKKDLLDFIRVRNHAIADSSYLEALPRTIDLTKVSQPDNPQLRRLLSEYLPFGYSRRHGDPSRPWNAFEIRTRDEKGNVTLDYSGNWRDVFQNWEALGRSFPHFYPAMIATFVNASTADGYNPYRIGRSGVDWEVPDESDPWASIGYWGDHQINYLLCLLEWAHAHAPTTLAQLLNTRIFSYMQVPYRLAEHEQILSDPKNSVHFDWDLHGKISERVQEMGSDGCLLQTPEGQPVLVTLAEKLLVPALAKFCAFVPGGGIWLNTQRPEWNDANNALAGWGCSLVTLFHLYRYLQFLGQLYEAQEDTQYQVSKEVAEWCSDVENELAGCGEIDNPTAQFCSMDALGRAASRYRANLYAHGIQNDSTLIEASSLAEFAALRVKRFSQRSIKRFRRIISRIPIRSSM